MNKENNNEIVIVNKDDNKTREFPLKKSITAVIFYIQFALGIASRCVGPTLIDLKVIYNQPSIDSISLYFTAGSFGYMTGAMFGCTYKYLNRQLMVSLFAVFMGIGLATVPHGKSLPVLYGCGFLVSVGAGGLDASQNIWIMEMWQEQSPPVLHTAKFIVGLGAIFAPALVKPFLSGDIKNQTLNGTSDGIDRSAKLSTPFAINGIICAVGGLMMLILFLVKKYQKPDGLALNTGRTKSLITGRSATAITILGAVFYGFYAIMDITFIQFLPAYSHYSPVGFTEQEGSSLMVGLSTANVISKFIFILVAFKISPPTILYTNYTIVILPFIIMTYFQSPAGMWTAAIVFGIGSSAMLPTILAYLETYLVMTNNKGTLITLSVGALGAAVPAFVGKYIDNQPFLLVYESLVNTSVSIAAFIAIHFIVLFSLRGKNDRLINKIDN